MPARLLNWFREVVLIDSEFRRRGDGLQEVRCVCALELRSGREHRIWCEGTVKCPYPLGDDCVLVAHYASAELLSHTSLGWPIPANVLDTCVEFSGMTAGKRRRDQPRTLVGALAYFGLPHIGQEEKDEMRALALADKPNAAYGEGERRALIGYCFSDVIGIATLLPRIEDFLCR